MNFSSAVVEEKTKKKKLEIARFMMFDANQFVKLKHDTRDASNKSLDEIYN